MSSIAFKIITMSGAHWVFLEYMYIGISDELKNEGSEMYQVPPGKWRMQQKVALEVQ